jgi:hypothetical protein
MGFEHASRGACIAVNVVSIIAAFDAGLDDVIAAARRPTIVKAGVRIDLVTIIAFFRADDPIAAAVLDPHRSCV